MCDKNIYDNVIILTINYNNYNNMGIYIVQQIVLSTDHVDCGSICSLCWSPDSTQVAAVCANGRLMISTLVERLEYFVKN